MPNFLEHQPQFLVPLLIAGLRYPVASAVLGLAWCVARVMYAVGYVTEKARGAREDVSIRGAPYAFLYHAMCNASRSRSIYS